MPMGDGTFYELSLEEKYQEHLRTCRAPPVARFSAFRFCLLVAVALRAWLNGTWCSDDWLFLVGAASNLLPLLAVLPLFPPRLARRLAYAAVLTDVLQAAIGCAAHSRMAPSHAGIPPLAALAYLPFGSTALWMVAYATFSSLPFHLELVKASLVCTVLLSNSEAVCGSSEGLLVGYGALHGALLSVGRRLRLKASSLAGPLWSAAAALGMQMPPSSDGTSPLLASSTAAGAGETAAAAAEAQCGWWWCWQPGCELHRERCSALSPGVQLCLRYQTVLLMAIFLTTMWAVYCTQHGMRCRFLRSRLGGTAGSGPGSSNGPSSRAARLLCTAAAHELVGLQEADGVEFLCLAVPALLCVLFVVSLTW